MSQFEIDPPIVYTPGQESIIMVMDGSPSNPVQVIWYPCISMTSAPTWPAVLPSPPGSCTVGGNDNYTRLLLHGTGQNGSPNFQDNSGRNYTVRFFGNARTNGAGYYNFDGTNSIIAPELYAPGYGTDLNPAHNDWNPSSRDFTFDATVNPTAVTAFGTAQTRTLAIAANVTTKRERKVAPKQPAQALDKVAIREPLQLVYLASATTQIQAVTQHIPTPAGLITPAARSEENVIKTKLRQVTATMERVPLWVHSVTEWLSDDVLSHRMLQLRTRLS